ncbi:histidine phosphatase family protein [Pleomorphomonas oryzae]|uniref:histidine phosphatase family protein n=1 Tax=Pleomorphomonas oryzae TaxID=261934 RepID=UPI00041EC382|nr:histidine phosphatase family protein [Pleomorphomonas oryzae]
MAARLTLISVPTGNDRRAPHFPGRDRLDLPAEGLPEAVSRCLADADRLVHPPEIAIGAGHPAPVETTKALSDLDYGNWTNRAIADIAGAEPAAFELWRTDMTAAPHGGESFAVARQRVGRWLASLAETPVVALCPTTIVRLALVTALEAPLPLIWRLDPMPWSATELTRHGGRWALRLT